METYNLLVIDDDPNIRNLLTELLAGRNEFKLLIAGDGKEAVRQFAENRIDMVLTDIHMPGFTGLELMADMKKINFKPEILVMTANATPENVETARRLGARSMILKPFDDLEVIEAEINKALRAVRAARGHANGDGNGHGASGAAAAPAAPPPPAEAAPPPPPPPPPQPAPALSQAPPVRPAAAGPAQPPARPAPQAPTAARPVPPAPSARPASAAQEAKPAPQAPTAPRPAPIAAVEPEPHESAHPAPAAAPSDPHDVPEEDVPALPADLDALFRMATSLDTGRLRMQVPIVCLQTWEERQAIAALRRLAADLHREFYVWSAARGLVKEAGQGMGETYRDAGRALEFIRRQKNNGLYVLADFRPCLEDRTVVRVLREMVMDHETARLMLVLTAPRLPAPPELAQACATFDWPASGGADLTALYQEVVAEVAASTGNVVRLDTQSRDQLLNAVKEMPAGRARFEIARRLMTAAQKG